MLKTNYSKCTTAELYSIKFAYTSIKSIIKSHQCEEKYFPCAECPNSEICQILEDELFYIALELIERGNE